MQKQLRMSALGLMVALATTPFAVAQTASEQSGPVTIDAGAAVINSQNSMIQFTGTHKAADPEPRVGHFRKFEGTLTVSDGKLQSLNVEIDVASLKTPIVKLTNHLKSPDFFDAREYPKATFKSTGIEDGGSQVVISGELTLMEQTKAVQIPAKLNISENGIMMEAQFTIDRTEFGMDGMTERIDENVALLVTVGKSAETHADDRGKFKDPMEMFTNRDKNGDGKLEGDEIPKMMRQRVGTFDTDGDGAISKDEMETRMGDMRRGRGPRSRPPGSKRSARDADN